MRWVWYPRGVAKPAEAAIATVTANGSRLTSRPVRRRIRNRKRQRHRRVVRHELGEHQRQQIDAREHPPGAEVRHGSDEHGRRVVTEPALLDGLSDDEGTDDADDDGEIDAPPGNFRRQAAGQAHSGGGYQRRMKDADPEPGLERRHDDHGRHDRHRQPATLVPQRPRAVDRRHEEEVAIVAVTVGELGMRLEQQRIAGLEPHVADLALEELTVPRYTAMTAAS